MRAASNGWTRRRWLRASALGLASSEGFPAGPGGTKPLRGIFPVLSTPYTESGEVDYEGLEREVVFLERCGVHGMVWPQLASEYFKLTRQERIQGMEVIAKAAGKRKAALVFGVQGPDVKAALEYLRHAERLEPDALIAIPPTEARSLEDFRGYYMALAEATERPLFIQTTGGARGIEPKIETIVELARRYPNLGYVKEEYRPVIGRMKQLAQHRPVIRAIFSGGGGRGLMYEMRLGMDGTMPGAAYADLYVRVWEAYQAKRLAEAREVFSKLLLMLNCEQQVPGTQQYILKKRGVARTLVSRVERIELGEAEVREIEFQWEGVTRYLRFERL